jgi:exosortase/archaeosortase family protein
MKKESKILKSILIRYLILILVAIPNLFLFYFIFTPLTIYPVYFLLNLAYGASLMGNIILIKSILPIELIPACIAGAAYYLLLILNLATPKIKLNKRLKLIAISFVTLLLLNISRIFFLSIMAYDNSPLFDATHKIFWYLVSTLFVVGIWFWQVKKFKIKKIPIYSDLKFLYSKTKKS